MKSCAIDILLEIFASSCFGGCIYIKQLAATLDEPTTGMLRRIEELEACALVQRTPDAADGRRVIVSLTSGGRDLVLDMLENVCLHAAPV